MPAPPYSSIPSPPLLRRGAREAGGVVRGARHPPPPSAAPSSREEGKIHNPAQFRPRALPREPELDHPPRHGFGLLHVRKMARVGDLLEFRAGKALAVAPAVGERREAVLRAPEKQGRDADAMQPSPELRIVH